MSRTRVCQFYLREFGDRNEMTYHARRARHPMPNRFFRKTDSIGRS